jgi:hypothetical protein
MCAGAHRVDIRRVLAEAAIEFVDGEPQIGLKK